MAVLEGGVAFQGDLEGWKISKRPGDPARGFLEVHRRDEPVEEVDVRHPPVDLAVEAATDGLDGGPDALGREDHQGAGVDGAEVRQGAGGRADLPDGP